jgi:leucine dehydrogenase
MVCRVAEDGLAAEYVPLKDAASGLEGVIAIHSTILGPGAGGCRLWSYPSLTEAANDATRLAEGMSYKNALAGLPLGGAKAVLRKPEGPFDRIALFRAFGQAVERLGGRYVTAEDVGTTTADMTEVASRTRHVAGLPQRDGRPGGDPSPWTARGVFIAMKLAAEYRLGKPLADCTVAVQGLGHVGAALAGLLHEAGARLVVADVNPANLAGVAGLKGVRVVAPGEIVGTRSDILSPCALGGVLTPASIETLHAKVVCGAANNQLGSPDDGRLLAQRGILYAPDYVVNAGGIINVAGEYLGWDGIATANRVERIAMRLLSVLKFAEQEQLPTNLAADALARRVLAEARQPAAA